ncbi:FGFR1 oncogene partner 2 homolog [Teleopsis dalmanni]|uniref:FGFR1 oncogene partner 2 homolog n=1 Tax=Teleopsis dalmanni TaxID=139649 RepID=UPI0018CE7224|nr:FGFR1 oncogene partner 2 homolog [Teleopsis dalmanni]
MSNISVGTILWDAQRMSNRVKDLDALGSALLVEAEGNNRLVDNLRHYQGDIESLNRISNNKSNADMVNRIHQQNANSSEILKENRELKVCIEDYERAMELIMQKYREHTANKVLENKINFKEVYNERLWSIIYEQREKINEMAAVMHRAAYSDDESVNNDLQIMSRLRLENQTLRELLQISTQYGTASNPIRFNEHLLQEKGVQTESVDGGDSADELSLSTASAENTNNNSVIQVSINTPNNINPVLTANVAIHATVTDNAQQQLADSAENNNGPPFKNNRVTSAAPAQINDSIRTITPDTPSDILVPTAVNTTNVLSTCADTVKTTAKASAT